MCASPKMFEANTIGRPFPALKNAILTRSLALAEQDGRHGQVTPDANAPGSISMMRATGVARPCVRGFA